MNLRSRKSWIRDPCYITTCTATKFKATSEYVGSKALHIAQSDSTQPVELCFHQGTLQMVHSEKLCHDSVFDVVIAPDATHLNSTQSPIFWRCSELGDWQETRERWVESDRALYKQGLRLAYSLPHSDPRSVAMCASHVQNCTSHRYTIRPLLAARESDTSSCYSRSSRDHYRALLLLHKPTHAAPHPCSRRRIYETREPDEKRQQIDCVTHRTSLTGWSIVSQVNHPPRWTCCFSVCSSVGCQQNVVSG